MKEGSPRPVFSIAVYSWLLVLLLIVVLLSVLLLPWTLAFDRDRRAVAGIGAFLLRTSLRAPSRWRPAMDSISRIDLSRPAVVVMNHRSIADIAIAVSVPGGPRLCAKPWVGRIPLMSAAMRASGHILFDPADPGEVRDAIEALEGLLRRGTSVVFFPEGTRRREPGLGPFEGGAFYLAVRCGVDVLPVVLEGTDALVPPGRILFHDVDVIALPLPRMAPGRDRDALSRAVRAAMATAGGDPPG